MPYSKVLSHPPGKNVRVFASDVVPFPIETEPVSIFSIAEALGIDGFLY